MSKLHPGMLAMVYGLTQRPEYNGICVELVEFVRPGQKFPIPGYPDEWGANDTSKSWWVCTGPQLHPISIDEPTSWGLLLPKNLMPLEGPDEDFENERGIYNTRRDEVFIPMFAFPSKTWI